jgi:4-amino-4-deoxy-L-arabinose transferase-like glycosyltransferase
MLETTATGRAAMPGVTRRASLPLAVLGASMAFAGMLVDPTPGTFGAFAAYVAIAVGLACCAIAVVLVAGGFSPPRSSPDTPSQGVASTVPGKALLPGLSLAAAGAASVTALVHAAAIGSIPYQRAVLGVALPGAFLVGVFGVADALARLGVFGQRLAETPRDILATGGWWLITITTLLYLPMLGSFGLIDPWEPEYAEVARGMLSRKDWISLWWGDQGWFLSKPILAFALMAASLAWFGVDHRPDALLAGIAEGRLPQPEWAVRLPMFLLSLCSVYVLYAGATRAFGKRGAFWGGLILVTVPYWFFLSRQSMTDMAYLAPLAAALGFLFVALSSEPEALVRTYEVTVGRRTIALSARELSLFVIVGLGLIQVFYLLSRHVTLDLAGFPALSFHRDQVFEGSPGNCTLPGNAPCRPDAAAIATPLQPALTAVAWAAALATLVWRLRGESRVERLAFVAFWTCVALAFLGKAAPGLVLPLCTLITVTVATGRSAALARAEWLNAALIFAALVAPWFVQELARHGSRFFDQLFLYDMYKRAFEHVHDTNKGDDTSFRYYVWQLGYGLFPWSGIIAAGVLSSIGKATHETAPQASTLGTYLLMLWTLATFGLFSIAGTKFHHYVAPMAPAVAILAGAALDDWWRERKAALPIAFGLLATVVVAIIARDLAREESSPTGPARLLHLFVYLYTRPWPPALHFERELAVAGAAAALLTLALAVPAWRRGAVVALGVIAVAFSAWCMDVYLLRLAPHWGQRETISEYYRRRESPDEILVAYAQNWMGENFYTGNHVATFKVPGNAFKRWVDERRKAGARVFFVTTEHATIPRVQRDVGEVQSFEILTTRELNNKFALARVSL